MTGLLWMVVYKNINNWNGELLVYELWHKLTVTMLGT